jgi:hypothetical protein
MKTVQAYIADKQQLFARHPFFSRLARNAPLREINPVVSNLSFWVMAFQDVLRLNEARVEQPDIKKLARHHRAEDAGHDKWFLGDLQKIDGSAPDIRALFSSAHAATRDASYALVSEVFRATTDVERITLLLSLESTGHIFFENMANYLERMSVVQSLRYFSRHHIDVEKSHEVFEEEMHGFLDSIVLSEDMSSTAMNLVDRVYSAFHGMFNHFEALGLKESARSLPAGSSPERPAAANAHLRVA